MFDLVKLKPRGEAEQISEGIAALIDGLYIRRALKQSGPERTSAVALIHDYLDTMLARETGMSKTRPDAAKHSDRS